MSHPVLPLIPYPTNCRQNPGSFTLGEETRIIADAGFTAAAELIMERLRVPTSLPLVVNDGASVGEEGAIRFIEAPEIEDPEAYELRVDDGGVIIRASGAAGAFYGGQTMLQLLPPAIFDSVPRHEIKWAMPQVEIEDRPRFKWRGAMLDSARHFQPVSFIRKFIDVLAQHKINVFHWHLVDDQGWRIEIKKYPRLTEVGSRRAETQLGHWFNKRRTSDGRPHEGYYTQAEIAELVAYAAARHIQILPEIEMPGHAQAAVASYPELGLLPEAVPVSTIWGVHKTLFNTKPATFQFLEDVLDEVIALFPFEYLHVGGDEAVKFQWEESPETQAHIKELGLADEHELQCWFIRRMGEFLRTRNRKLVGWDEILEGGLGEGATVMSWRGREGAIEAAAKGMDTVMCDHNFLYFDYYQGAEADELLAIGGNVTLEKIHSYRPISADEESAEALAKHMIGLQAELWTEYIPTTSRLEYMTFPRMCAFAEVAWSGDGRPGYGHFLKRLAPHLSRLDGQDIRYRAPLEHMHLPA